VFAALGRAAVVGHEITIVFSSSPRSSTTSRRRQILIDALNGRGVHLHVAREHRLRVIVEIVPRSHIEERFALRSAICVSSLKSRFL